MISNDERREVAARLRKQKPWSVFTDFQDCIGDLCDAVFDDEGDLNDMFGLQKALAELIDQEPEHTCKIDGTYDDEFGIYDHLSCGHVAMRQWPEKTNYCENCGAEVVN